MREILTKQRDNKQLYECATNYRKSELKKKIKECKRYGQKYKTKDIIQNAPKKPNNRLKASHHSGCSTTKIIEWERLLKVGETLTKGSNLGDSSECASW